MLELTANILAIITVIASIVVGYIFSNNIASNKMTLLKAAQGTIKAVTSFGVLAFTVHIGLLLVNHEELVLIHFFGYCGLGTAILMLSSFLFNMCTLMRLSILYNFLVRECIIIQDNTDFFDGWLFEARLIMFIIGVILSTLLVKLEVNNKCSDCNINN